MSHAPIDPKSSGLLIVDLQNDFLHPEGAYGRAGQTSEAIAALPRRLAPLADKMREREGWLVSTHFTLVAGKKGEPFISPHLKTLRPFLAKGDFLQGAWGHRLCDQLQPADLSVSKVAYSAFYQTNLEWVLRKAGIATLIVCGIVTNGGVASTLRDAQVRDFRTILLSDGCAAFSAEVHRHALADLATLSETASCAEAMALLDG